MIRWHFFWMAVAYLAASAAGQDEKRRLNVAFLVWGGMELIEAMGPAHVFSFAPGMDGYTVSKTSDPIKSEFVTITPQYTLDNCPEPDVIVMPGGSVWIPMGDPEYRGWLKERVSKATLTVSVCNSAILLADLGLLDGKEATCGPSNLDDIMLLGEGVKGYINRRWVHSGNIITSQSYLAGIDAAIYAVRVLRGEEGERQVLRWSNYDGDLSRHEARHAEPGVIPVSRRREICRILMRDGVDAAVRRFHEWVASGKPAYTPPLDEFDERNMFQWMAWGHQRLGRHDVSLKICTFKARVWPGSARERAYLGEALMKAGRLDEALGRLLEALEIEEDNGVALVLLKRLLSSPEYRADDGSGRARAILGEHAHSSRSVLVNENEPGVPLRVLGTVLDSKGNPVEGARVYVYHADAKGQYTPTKTMDEANARLFAWMRTGGDGQYEFRTIRPGGYPIAQGQSAVESMIPAHIHFEVSATGYNGRRFQMVFADDPRMGPEHWRKWALREGNPVVTVRMGPDGLARCTHDIVLEQRAADDDSRKGGERDAAAPDDDLQ